MGSGQGRWGVRGQRNIYPAQLRPFAFMEQETASKQHRPLVSLLSARWPSCLHGAARAFSPSPSSPPEPSTLGPFRAGALRPASGPERSRDLYGCTAMTTPGHPGLGLGPWTSCPSSESVICHLGMWGRHGLQFLTEVSIPSTTGAPSGNRGHVRSWRLEFGGSLHWGGAGLADSSSSEIYALTCTHIHVFLKSIDF